MKRPIFLLLLSLFPCALVAQIETRIQKGVVRSQTFANKPGGRIVGAIITRQGDENKRVLSLSKPEKGYFELSLGEMGNSKVYYISSVEGPKGSDYKLLYPHLYFLFYQSYKL